MNIDLKKIAKLAQLQIIDEDYAHYEIEINNIIGLVQKMDEADVTDIEPMAHPLDIKQRTRDDVITEDIVANNQYEKLQNLTSHKENGYYLTPQVIE